MNSIYGNLKFSVITPSYNQGKYIEKTITSVLEQNYGNFEHIIIDGGSQDETLSILRKFPHLTIVSEHDDGQADAINKGLKMATGDVIAWINSDDWYEPGVFLDVSGFFGRNPGKMVVMGDCHLVKAQGDIFYTVVNRERGNKELRRYWIGRSIPTQPAIFFRRELIDEFGYLDTSLHYAMDYDLWLRFTKRYYFHRINRVVANYRFHSGSKGGDQDWSKFIPEWERAYRNHVGIYERLIDHYSRILARMKKG